MIHSSHRKHLQHYNFPGHAHELTFSCYRKQPLLARDRSRQWLVQAMDNARRKRGFSLLAFVIMPEHVHIIVYPQGPGHNVSWHLKSIKQPVARKASAWLQSNDPEWHDKLCDRSGRFCFWQPGGGYDRNITGKETLLKMIEYIHHNPVRRGLVEKAVDWQWSSAGWYESRSGVLAMDAFSGEI